MSRGLKSLIATTLLPNSILGSTHPGMYPRMVLYKTKKGQRGQGQLLQRLPNWKDLRSSQPSELSQNVQQDVL